MPTSWAHLVDDRRRQHRAAHAQEKIVVTCQSADERNAWSKSRQQQNVRRLTVNKLRKRRRRRQSQQHC